MTIETIDGGPAIADPETATTAIAIAVTWPAAGRRSALGLDRARHLVPAEVRAQARTRVKMSH
jgi:hypothetical protein